MLIRETESEDMGVVEKLWLYFVSCCKMDLQFFQVGGYRSYTVHIRVCTFPFLVFTAWSKSV